MDIIAYETAGAAFAKIERSAEKAFRAAEEMVRADAFGYADRKLADVISSAGFDCFMSAFSAERRKMEAR